MARLASPGPHRRCRRRARLPFNRRFRAQLVIRLPAVTWSGFAVAAHRLASGSRDVQRDHAVAGQLASGHRVLSDDETDQLRRAAERAIKTGTQAGATHRLRRLTGGLAHVITDRLAARASSAAGSPRAFTDALGYCGSVGHRRY